MNEWCEVRIGDGRIEIRYKDNEDRMVRYTGTETRPNHFDLKAEPGNAEGSVGTLGNEGRAELDFVRIKDRQYLEGKWREGTATGEWYISLG